MKRWEKRRFFVRNWEPYKEGTVFGPFKPNVVFSLPACKIYGYEDDSEFDADHQAIDAAMKRGFVFGRWFSTLCVDGEPGSQPFSELKLISKEEFEAAQRREWKDQKSICPRSKRK